MPLLGALCAGASSLPHPAFAQNAPDTRAPTIELEALERGVADRSQVFTVRASDERGLASVSLYHRREGRQPYTRSDMRALGESGYFTVAIPTDPEDLRAIEYYVQALDENGNRTVEGFAFEPFRRELDPATAPNAPVGRAAREADAEPIAEDGRSRRRWWSVALGVIAVGAIATLARDGDEDGATAPLVVEVQEPTL